MPARLFRKVVPLVAAVVCAVAASSFLRSGARADEPPYFAVRNARIVPVSGPVIENGTIVIAKGRIKAVGTDIQIPGEAWVIDGKGLTVYPGLIDAGTDLGLTAAAAPVAGPPGGRGPQRPLSRGPEDRPGTTPWVNAADELNPEDKRIETWRNAGFTTAVTAPKGGIFPGQGAVIDLVGERAGEMVVKSPATLPIAFQPSGNFAGFPDSLMGVLAYIHQVFIDTAWYEQAEPIYTAHPRDSARPIYDRTERVIARALRGNVPVLIPANNDIQIRRALKLAPEWSSRLILYGVQQGYDVADEIAASKIVALVSLKWPEAPKDADPDAPVSLRELRFRFRAPSTPIALLKAGVKFAFYSDGLSGPKDILKNANKAISAGLPAEVALRAFTLDAAEILGVADRLGSIEPGKIANLVVTDGDIFNEKTKVKVVFVDGQRFEVREPERPKEPPKGDMTGKWKLSYNTPQGPQEATADITMAPDGSLSGSVTSPMGSSAISGGWLSGDRFSFTISLQMGPSPADMTFSGTFEGNTLKGTVSVAGFSTEFTGTRPGGQLAAEQIGEGRR